MVKVGGIYKAQLKMYSKNYFAKIKVNKLFKQKLCDMTQEDVKREGYNSIQDFQTIWTKINDKWEAEAEPYVIEFEVMR